MTTDSDDVVVTEALAARTGTDPGDWFLVFKARYGMEIVFRALRDVRGPGDVATQAFTCSTAIDPILVAGLTPVYGDVSPASISLDPERLVLSAGTRAVVIQHTFGIIDTPAAGRLGDAAHRAGSLVVEDSAHCAGRMARDSAGAPLADVSIHSFGVEKMLPTRFGGAVWVNPRLGDGARLGDSALRARIVEGLRGAPVVGRRLDLVTRAYRGEVALLNRLPGVLSRPARGMLTSLRAFEPAVGAVEGRGSLPYRSMRPTAWMTRRIAAALPQLDEIEHRRGAAVTEYQSALASVVEVPSAIRAGDPLVRWPFFATDAAAALRTLAALRSAGVYAGNWYRPLLFPGVEDPSVYGYVPGDGRLVTSEDLSARVVNLPTTGGATQARRVAEVVRAATAAGGSSQT
jgi:dTDP-4-amino-4,6-dideoxygalactose transaminase